MTPAGLLRTVGRVLALALALALALDRKPSISCNCGPVVSVFGSVGGMFERGALAVLDRDTGGMFERGVLGVLMTITRDCGGAGRVVSFLGKPTVDV